MGEEFLEGRGKGRGRFVKLLDAVSEHGVIGKVIRRRSDFETGCCQGLTFGDYEKLEDGDKIKSAPHVYKFTGHIVVKHRPKEKTPPKSELEQEAKQVFNENKK